MPLDNPTTVNKTYSNLFCLLVCVYRIILFNRENLGVSSSSVYFHNEEVLADPVVARGELHHDAVRVAAVVELAPGQAADCVVG